MPFQHFGRIVLVLGLSVILGANSLAQEQKLTGLLSRSPLPANSMSYLNLPALKKLLADANIPLTVSDRISEVWLVSDLNLTSLTPNWEAGYAITTSTYEVEALAKALGGYVDMVGDNKVIWTPKQSYLVPLDNNRIGFLRPAKRSLAADWIKESNSSTPSNYLSQQARQAEDYLSLMYAVDLADVFSPVGLSNILKSCKSLESSKLDAAAKLLASTKGLTIIVGRRSLSECILTIEFGSSPADLQSVAPALLNDILNLNGTAAPEVRSWSPKVDGNKLSLQGPIAADTLDAILGIFSLRDHASQITENVETVASTDSLGDQTVTLSKEYFDKVGQYIERVRKYEAQSTGYRAKWNEQQARRIEEIGTLGVDPDLVDYSANVASILRNNGLAIRKGNVAAGQLAASQAESFGYGYDNGYYGGYGNTQQSALRGASLTSAQQRMAGFGSYQEAISAIDQLTGDVRRAMTAKYNVQF